MKTSNILLLTALLVLLSSLVAYNMAVKSAYATGDYKDPLRNHRLLGFQDFDEINVNASDLIHVRIEAGDKHGVYLKNNMDQLIQVTQEGKRLKIDVALADERNAISARPEEYHLIIRTPDVKAIRANAIHTVNGEVMVWQLNKARYFETYGVIVTGLTLDSLYLELDNGSLVKLRENKIGKLHAVAGSSEGSESQLQLVRGNVVQEAHLDIRNKSYLELDHIAIPQLSYTLSENARVNLSGASLSMLKK